MGIFHSIEDGFIRKQRLVFNFCRRLILKPLNLCTQISGRSGGTDGGYMIEAEYPGGLDLCICHDLVIADVLSVFDAEDIRGKHHGDRHKREVVGLLPGKNRENPFTACHRVHVRSQPESPFPFLEGIKIGRPDVLYQLNCKCSAAGKA